jgi:hypothetical protein
LAGGSFSRNRACRQSDRAAVWKSLQFKNAHSSPVLIDVDGQPEVAALAASEVIGFRTMANFYGGTLTKPNTGWQ